MHVVFVCVHVCVVSCIALTHGGELITGVVFLIGSILLKQTWMINLNLRSSEDTEVKILHETIFLFSYLRPNIKGRVQNFVSQILNSTLVEFLCQMVF